MKQITIKTQAEYDALPKKFKNYTVIIIDATEPIYEIRTVPENADVMLTGQTVVEYLYITVKEMRGSSQVKEMWESSQVNVMWGSSQVNVMRGSTWLS